MEWLRMTWKSELQLDWSPRFEGERRVDRNPALADVQCPAVNHGQVRAVNRCHRLHRATKIAASLSHDHPVRDSQASVDRVRGQRPADYKVGTFLKCHGSFLVAAADGEQYR